MANQFTVEERHALYALFSIDEHEIREGSTSKDKKKIQFFTYVRREAIQARLDELFFGQWELYFLNPANPYTYHDKHVDCAMGLSIRGIRREYNGSQEGGGLNGAKGAATDAFKRVASMWGIGLYLQSSPTIWVENYATYEGDKKVSFDWTKKDKVEADAMRQVEKWMKSIGASGNTISPTKEESPTPNPLDLDTHLGTPVIHETNEIKVVEVRLSDSKTPYIVAGGTTLFSRQPFRDLGYEADFIELLAEPKKAVYLPDAIVIGYTEITVDNKKQRTPVKVCRVSTGQIAEIQHTAKA